MMQPFLTIGIPTWNRCTYLKKMLKPEVRQIQRFRLDQSVQLANMTMPLLTRHRILWLTYLHGMHLLAIIVTQKIVAQMLIFNL